MASTTSNTDLVPREALDELKALDAQLKTTIDNMQALLKPVKEINNALSKSATNYKTLTDAINKLNAVESDYKKNMTEHKRLKTEIERLHARLAQTQSAEAKEVAMLKEQIRQQNLEIKNSAKEMLAASGSIDQMRAKINLLTQQYNAMSEAVRNSDVGQAMQKQIKEMNDQVSSLEQGVGNYRRNVGNYAIGFTPLQFQVQQLARELPSLTVSAQQFFLAISNNLPMFADELVRVRAENKALNKDHKQSTPVWKQLLGAITSWQTALVVGITVITAYGKEIGAFFKELFTGKNAFDAVTEANKRTSASIDKINSQFVVEKSQIDALFEKLHAAKQGTYEYQKAKDEIISKYGKYLEGLDIEVKSLNNVDAAYKAITKSAQESVVERIKAEQLTEAYKKAQDEFDKAYEDISKGALNSLKSKNQEDADQLTKIIRGELEKTNTSVLGDYEAAYTRVLSKLQSMYGKKGAASIFSRISGGLKQWLDASTQLEKEEKSIETRLSNIYNEKTSGISSNIIKETEGIIKRITVLKKEVEDIRSGSLKLDGETAESGISRREKEINELEASLDVLTGKSAKDIKQLNEVYANLAQSQLEARKELAVSMMEASAEENKAIVENEKASYDERVNALIAFAEQKKQAVQQSAQAQIDVLIEETAEELKLDENNAEDRAKIEKELADEINLIRWKASEEAKKIDQEQVDTAIELEKQRVDGIINEITREAAERRRKMSLDESNELKQLSNNYAAGLLTTEQYEQAKEDVTRRYTKKRFDAEWAMLSQQLEVMLKAEGASQDEILAIRKKMEDAKVAYAIKANNDIIKNNDKTGRKLSEVPQKLKDLTKENIAQILQAWSDAFSSVMDLMSASLEGELNALDEEAEANEKWAEEETERIDRLEEAGAISKEQADARKAAVDDQAAAREAEIEQKKKDIQQRQARYDKASSAMKIMVSTAVAIMSAWELGPILGPILGALAAAMGAAQLATVLATPIPEYAHGTQDHPGGLAVVGDGGRPEMIVTPGGSVYKTPATDTLLDLPEHSVVLPDFSQAINALAFEKLPEIPVRQTDSAIKLSEMEGLFKTTNKQIGAFMDSFNRYKANRRYDSMFNRKKTTKIS